MSKDKGKQHPKGASPDETAKTKKKASVELTEEQLRKTSGGSFQWGIGAKKEA
jgi:hypothetical protein